MTVQELISRFAQYRRRYQDIEITQMCGLGASSTSTKLKTTSAVVVFIYNQQVTVAINAAITTTACTQQVASTFCYYLVSVSSAGSFTTTKGTNNAYALPATPAGTVPVGAFLITTDSSHTFTAGTTAFSATGVTAAFYDIDAGIALSLINQAQTRLERGVTLVRKNHPRTIQDFQHMLVRASIALDYGDATIILPFSNFKSFVDEGVNITDTAGITTRLDKVDAVPIGVTPLYVRPQQIAQRITAETTFTPDGFPGMEFDIWPIADQDYTLDVQAYQYSPALDGVIYSNNWLTDNAPDVLLFGALTESSLFFGADPQNAEWKARWEEAVWTLYASQQKSIYAGSHIYTRFPDPLRQRANMGMESSSAGILSYGFVAPGD